MNEQLDMLIADPVMPIEIQAPVRQPTHPLLLLLFIGSGCSALIYEIVWYQMLQLVIGLTTLSLGVLLGTFMGGMCLGSYLLPRLIGKRRHPLRVYALLELGIGLIGLAVLHGMPWVGRIYTDHSGHGAAEMMLRGAVAALCLLPPTVLMGATLPAVARWVEATPRGVAWLGFFYGGNIAGAVFGCLLAGFYLLRVYDVATATNFAAAINFGVAVTGLVLAGRRPYRAEFCSEKPLKRFAGDFDAQDAALKRGANEMISDFNAGSQSSGRSAVYITIALSGLTALGAEVIWTRLLSLLFGVTVYTFSIILAVFLVGLGLGSAAGAMLARTASRPRLALGGCQLLLMLAIAWAAAMICRSLPYWPVSPDLITNPWYGFQLDLARGAWVILPGACLWGASFPLALAAVAGREEDPGRMVGGVYAANTVGAIVGALAFSIWVVPGIGTQWSQRLMIVLAAVSALLMFWGKGSAVASSIEHEHEQEHEHEHENIRVGVRLRRAWAMAGVMVLAGGLAWSVARTPWALIAFGRYTAGYVPRVAPEITEEKKVPLGAVMPDVYCTYAGEGVDGSVAVTVTGDGVRSFHAAGKIQASSEAHDMRLQRMLGHLSALVHPEPKSVLVVACGAGVTAGTFVLYPSVKRIVICDIEPLVPKHVAPRFKYENYDVVNDPRVEIVNDDGRHFIRTTKEKFDIITSDPIDPWVKGCAALNTVEYFEMCKAHLNPGGVVSQWLPLYQSDVPTVKSVVGTFFTVFKDGTIWSNDEEGMGYDTVLLGQAEPTKIDMVKLEKRVNSPDYDEVKASLQDVGFNSAIDLLQTYAGQAADLQPWLKDAQINNDRDLRLQYLAGLGAASYKETAILAEITKCYRFPDKMIVAGDAMKKVLQKRMKR